MQHRPIPVLTATQVQRFWNNVDHSGANGCWLWRGCIERRGRYERPVLTLGSRHSCFHFGASRIAYYLHNGIDPGELEVCHACDNPLCVNPQHLWLGTQRDNLTDMVAKKRHRPAPARKLVADDIRRIRNAVGSQQEIADRFGITQANISAIRLHKTWKGVA